jgi:hypothetical protein
MADILPHEPDPVRGKSGRSSPDRSVYLCEIPRSPLTGTVWAASRSAARRSGRSASRGYLCPAGRIQVDLCGPARSGMGVALPMSGRHPCAPWLSAAGHSSFSPPSCGGRAAQPVVAGVRARPGCGGGVQVVGAWILCAARARSSSTATAAATRAAASAIRVICQPGMPPSAMTRTGGGGGAMPLP